MKRYLLLFFVLIILLFNFNCTVNESTSCLTIQNKSDTTITNIKIGNTVICSYLAPGAQIAYYFSYWDIEGELTTNGATSGRYIWGLMSSKGYMQEANGTYLLKAGNYHFYGEIFESGNEYWITLWCEEHGENYSEDPEVTYDDFYKD